LQAFDEYPIRIDVEASTVDVVWRERRQSDGNNALRRERFVFEDIFSSPHSNLRFNVYCRYRTRSALASNTNLVFICLGSGDNSYGYPEPTVSLVLGERGGSGVASNIIYEIFNSSGSTSTTSAESPDFTVFKTIRETASLRVTFSFMLLYEGVVIDLLCNSIDAKEANARNVTSVELLSVADFERVVGAISGRRAAVRETIATFRKVCAESDLNISENPWISNSNSNEATLITRISLHGKHKFNYFHIVCPCGEKWDYPGNK